MYLKKSRKTTLLYHETISNLSLICTEKLYCVKQYSSLVLSLVCVYRFKCNEQNFWYCVYSVALLSGIPFKEKQPLFSNLPHFFFSCVQMTIISGFILHNKSKPYFLLCGMYCTSFSYVRQHDADQNTLFCYNQAGETGIS